MKVKIKTKWEDEPLCTAKITLKDWAYQHVTEVTYLRADVEKEAIKNVIKLLSVKIQELKEQYNIEDNNEQL